MNVTIEHHVLNQGVQTATRALSSRSTITGGSQLQLSATGSILTLYASDGEISIQTTIPADVADPGIICVPGRYFADVIARLGDGPVRLSVPSGRTQVEVSWHNTNLQVHGWDPETAQGFDEVRSDTAVDVEAAALKAAIGRTLSAVSSDDTRPILTGVLFQLAGDSLSLVATDGFRMCYQRVSISESVPTETRVVVPSRSLSQLSQLLGTLTTGTAAITLSERSITFNLGDTLIASTLLSGQFPAYEQVIPRSFPITYTVPRADLLSACERAAIVATETSRAVSLRFSGSTIVISSKSVDRGSITDEVSFTGPEDEFAILFNVRLLIDALRASDTDSIIIDAIQPSQLIRIKNTDDDTFFYIVLPLRQQSE